LRWSRGRLLQRRNNRQLLQITGRTSFALSEEQFALASLADQAHLRPKSAVRVLWEN
jgi:hypothetical protein